MFTRRSPTFLIVRFNYSPVRSFGRHVFFFFFYCIYLISSTHPPPLPFSRWTLGLIRLSLPHEEWPSEGGAKERGIMRACCDT